MKINFDFMKYLIAFVLILVTFSVNAQNRFPSVDSAKNYVLRYVKNSAVETFTNWRAQNVAFGTLELLDSLAGSGAIDSIWKTGDTLKYSKSGVNYTIGTVSGSTLTLQQVTTAGNSIYRDSNYINFYNEDSTNQIGYIGYGGSDVVYKSGIGSTNYTVYRQDVFEKVVNGNQNQNLLPDSSGYITHRVSVNGNTYDASNKGTVNIGNTDTATVVKAYVTNAEAVTITKGQVVYIFGASGDRASVKLAKNTSDTFSSKTLGIVRTDIAAGQAGWITTQGQVSGINLGAYSPGDILWLDSVAGGFTKNKPQAPYHGVFVGVVERANAGNGLIYVKPQNGVELDELHDVRITSLANNEIIRYNSSLGYWENKSITTALGYTPLNVTDTTAMLSPYLRKADTLSLSNRIANASGVQWSGIDSNYAERLSLNGFHEVDETMFRASAGNNPGLFQGSKYTGTGSWQGGVQDDVNYIIGSTSTSASGSSSAIYGGVSINQLYVPSSNWFIYTTRVRIPTLNDGTQKFYVNFGVLPSAPSATLTEGVGFLYDLDGSTTGSSASADWQTYSVNSSTRTFNQNYTGVAVAANTWTKLKVIFNNTEAYYYIDGTLVARHTSNLPASDNIAPCHAIIKTAGIVARTYQIDYSTIDIKYSTPR
jgi:hypothetical protein